MNSSSISRETSRTISLWGLANGQVIQCVRIGSVETAAQWNREIALIGTQWRWVQLSELTLAEGFEHLVGCPFLLHGKVASHAESARFPSPAIDAALCDLIAQIENYSNDFFDAQWLHLKEPELEALIVLLLQHWTEQLTGQLLGSLLLMVREQGRID